MGTARLMSVLLAATAIGSGNPANAGQNEELEVHAWQASAQRVPEVERQIVKRLAEDPQSAHLHYLLTHIQLRNYFQNPFELRYLFQAIQLGRQTIDLKPDSVFALLTAIEIFEFIGENRELESALAGANTNYPTSWRVKFATLRTRSARMPKEKVILEFAKLANSSPVAKRVVGRYLVSLAQSEIHLDQRLHTLQRMLNLVDATDLHIEAAAVLGEMSNHRSSLQHLRQISQSTSMMLPEQSARVALLTAKAHERQGHLKNAQKILADRSDLIAKFPKQETTARFLLGSIALQQSNFPAARREFGELIRLDPRKINIVHDEYVRREQFEEYLRLGDQLMAESGTAERYALQAWTHRQIGQTSAAITNLKNAVELDPGKVQYHQQLGLAHIDQGNFKLAQVSIENAFFLNPANHQTELIRECLEAIQNRTTDPSLFNEKKIPSSTACDTISLLLDKADLKP